MARLGEYLQAWAALLGDENKPHFAGIVKGSAVLRARVGGDAKLTTKVRLVAAREGVEDQSARAYEQLATMMVRDQCTGEVRDSAGAVILEFKRQPTPEVRPVVMQDSATVDGVVISLAGADDTVHLRLQDADGAVYKVTLRNLETARALASHFRASPIRAHVHGSWSRDADGSWRAVSLYLDRFEELDDEPAASILSRLSALPGNRWAVMADADLALRELRGDE